MRERQQNSTSHPLSFLMVSSSDHLTGVTGITPTVTISKDGGAFAAPSGAVTELANGWYSLAGNATDRNTLGAFLLHATGTGCDPMDRDYTIVGYDPFNGVNLGITAVPNAVAAASGGLPTVGTSTGQINPDGTGKVSLAAASIDIPTFTPAAWEVLTRRIVATGTTSPVTADTYKIGGFDSNNNIYYVSTTLGTPAYMWNNGSGWTISTTLLTNGASYFTTGSSANVLGPYTAQGSATGTPSVTFKGGAMLDALQLSGPVAANITANNDKTGYSLNLSQTLSGVARALDSIADGALTVGDSLMCSIGDAAGKESVSGTIYLVQTPYTGTTIRTFTLNNSTTPTSRS